MNRFEKEWDSYFNAVYPREVAPGQKEQLRTAFFAGFSVCFSVLTEEAAALPDEESFAILDQLKHALGQETESQIKNCVEKISRGRAQ